MKVYVVLKYRGFVIEEREIHEPKLTKKGKLTSKNKVYTSQGVMHWGCGDIFLTREEAAACVERKKEEERIEKEQEEERLQQLETALRDSGILNTLQNPSIWVGDPLSVLRPPVKGWGYAMCGPFVLTPHFVRFQFTEKEYSILLLHAPEMAALLRQNYYLGDEITYELRRSFGDDGYGDLLREFHEITRGMITVIRENMSRYGISKMGEFTGTSQFLTEITSGLALFTGAWS